MVWVYKWLPRFPTFGTVVSRGRTTATPHPLTKLCPHGDRTKIARHCTRDRNHLAAAAIPCSSKDGSGYSYPRRPVALSQRTLLLNTDTYVDRNPFWTKRLTGKTRKDLTSHTRDSRKKLVANWENLQINNANRRTNQDSNL